MKIHTIVFIDKNATPICKTYFIVINVVAVIKAYKKIFTTVKNVSNVMKENEKIHSIVINAGNAILDSKKTIIIALNVIFVFKKYKQMNNIQVSLVYSVIIFMYEVGK